MTQFHRGVVKVLREQRRSFAYILFIKDIYRRANTSIRTLGGDTNEFSIDIGLHQGLTLCPFLFTNVTDELTKEIQDDIPWCMSFASSVLCDKKILRSDGFTLSK